MLRKRLGAGVQGGQGRTVSMEMSIKVYQKPMVMEKYWSGVEIRFQSNFSHDKPYNLE